MGTRLDLDGIFVNINKIFLKIFSKISTRINNFSSNIIFVSRLAYMYQLCYIPRHPVKTSDQLSFGSERNLTLLCKDRTESLIYPRYK
jgi:hypothetical protein